MGDLKRQDRDEPTATDTPTPSPTASSDGSGAPVTEDPIERLKELKQLNREGVITDEEFAEKKSDLLDEI